MAGIEGTSTPESADGGRAMEPGTDYRIDRAAPIEATERVDGGYDGAGDSTGYRERPLREFREGKPDEFIEPAAHTRPIDEFSDPDRLVDRINPEYGHDSRSYDVNCADCARSFERSWRGDFEEAAGRRPQLDTDGNIEPHGEIKDETEEWAGTGFRETPDTQALYNTLREGGPGSSAIVHTYFDDRNGQPAGHAYNVINNNGEIRVCDAQVHETFEWDPEKIHPWVGTNPEHISMAWDTKGKRIW